MKLIKLKLIALVAGSFVSLGASAQSPAVGFEDGPIDDSVLIAKLIVNPAAKLSKSLRAFRSLVGNSFQVRIDKPKGYTDLYLNAMFLAHGDIPCDDVMLRIRGEFGPAVVAPKVEYRLMSNSRVMPNYCSDSLKAALDGAALVYDPAAFRLYETLGAPSAANGTKPSLAVHLLNSKFWETPAGESFLAAKADIDEVKVKVSSRKVKIDLWATPNGVEAPEPCRWWQFGCDPKKHLLQLIGKSEETSNGFGFKVDHWKYSISSKLTQ